ncbi:hypothetical protein, partial [Hydrogenimonas sp.]
SVTQIGGIAQRLEIQDQVGRLAHFSSTNDAGQLFIEISFIEKAASVGNGVFGKDFSLMLF